MLDLCSSRQENPKAKTLRNEKSHSWSIIHSSNRNDWRTPPNFFQSLDQRFNFSFDLASDEKNKLVQKNFTVDDDALSHDWHKIKGWLWLNPPYGRGIGSWFQKAAKESALGAKIAVLAFSSTETEWFQSAWNNASEIWFFTKRIKFVNPESSESKSLPAPKGSALYIYDGKRSGSLKTSLVSVDKAGRVILPPRKPKG